LETNTTHKINELYKNTQETLNKRKGHINEMNHTRNIKTTNQKHITTETNNKRQTTAQETNYKRNINETKQTTAIKETNVKRSIQETQNNHNRTRIIKDT